MTGIVKIINHERGIIAVEVEINDFTVFEYNRPYAVNIGDIISGDLDSKGSKSLMNLSNCNKMDVIIQAVNCTLQNAQHLMENSI
ncbi:MAG: hypothetical protein WC637_14300 [Victivallales bacterium]|jgi:hypothetical protein